jgi:hypothetical protein
MKFRSLALITGLAVSGIVISGTFAPVQAVGILLTSEAGYTGPGLDLSAYAGGGSFTAGPASIPGGITFTSTTASSVLGKVGTIGTYFLNSNVTLGGNAVYAGLNGVAPDYMTFSFASAVRSFGAFLNYSEVGGAPTISTYDSSNNLLSTFDLSALAPISTPGGFNQFAFRGIDEGSAVISSFRLGGGYIVAAGSDDGSVAITPTSVPEPFTIFGTLIGGTAALRMRKKLKSTHKA